MFQVQLLTRNWHIAQMYYKTPTACISGSGWDNLKDNLKLSRRLALAGVVVGGILLNEGVNLTNLLLNDALGIG